MIIVVALDGYSASLRDVVLHDLVFDWLHEYRAMFGQELIVKLGTRSTVLSKKKRKIGNFIINNSAENNVLILTGKSYGATILLRDILPKHSVWKSLLNYGAVGMITVDPNFPYWFDWKPNLNNYKFNLPLGIDLAFNVYVESNDSKKQCGAIVNGSVNQPVRGYSHKTVIFSPKVESDFINVTNELMKIRRDDYVI
jgi:hypothetical protein